MHCGNYWVEKVIKNYWLLTELAKSAAAAEELERKRLEAEEEAKRLEEKRKEAEEEKNRMELLLESESHEKEELVCIFINILTWISLAWIKCKLFLFSETWIC